MLDSLLVAGNRVEQLLHFSVEGVHIEQLGSGNQPWDQKVAQAVAIACSQIVMPPADRYAWYAVHLRWFVQPRAYRRDLDNLRLKPILDRLTALGFWPDAKMEYVRAIYNEAVLIGAGGHEQVEVRVYGVLLSES